MEFTPVLRDEYGALFDKCEIRAERQQTIDDLIDRMLGNRNRYTGLKTIVPWFVIAAMHYLEDNLEFDKHLANGDPLTRRTVHVPKGRPPGGRPPFTWEQSAADILRFKGFDTWTDWTLPGILYRLEDYNGWGYREDHPTVLTPYLWSFSSLYTKGKFDGDGHFNKNLVSSQCGAAVLFKRMAATGLIVLDR